ncbi:MAG: hypothetical protein HOI03_02495 [Candidatus Marinimicrobia bacterium]|jgi:membrane-bound metal-dependent hydrolase YbcI (DUF457 family)|nr:hypothetical protein [Candidatus Neomarinimicrobiota bacterium]
MDTFSHALWGKGLFGYRGYSKTAIFFGAMPDLSSFGLLFFVNLFNQNGQRFGPPKLETIPSWLFFNYDLTHSFISAFICISIVYYFNKSIAFAMLAWPFHILLDFPFHSKAYFPTKLFFPLSTFSFDGIPWSNPEVWFPNIAGIIILFIYRIKNRPNQ